MHHSRQISLRGRYLAWPVEFTKSFVTCPHPPGIQETIRVDPEDDLIQHCRPKVGICRCVAESTSEVPGLANQTKRMLLNGVEGSQRATQLVAADNKLTGQRDPDIGLRDVSDTRMLTEPGTDQQKTSLPPCAKVILRFEYGLGAWVIELLEVIVVDRVVIFAQRLVEEFPTQVLKMRELYVEPWKRHRQWTR